MYTTLLVTHSWLRWAVILLAAVVLALAISGLAKGRAYGALDRKAGLFWMISFDIQLLLGAVLYLWLSPYTITSVPGWIKDATFRYWKLEHAAGMFLAVVAVHVGRVIVKRAKSDRGRHMAILVTTIISLLLVLGSIPWPGSKQNRPLFRTVQS